MIKDTCRPAKPRLKEQKAAIELIFDWALWARTYIEGEDIQSFGKEQWFHHSWGVLIIPFWWTQVLAVQSRIELPDFLLSYRIKHHSHTSAALLLPPSHQLQSFIGLLSQQIWYVSGKHAFTKMPSSYLCQPNNNVMISCITLTYKKEIYAPFGNVNVFSKQFSRDCLVNGF